MADELTRGTRLGDYDLLLRIGRGGMATVWIARQRAERPEQQRIVAIKAILSDLADEDEFVKMFLDEGRLVQRIRHPNVVELYEVGQEEDIMYMAMEWVEGDSLHTLIAEAGKRRPIPPEMAVRIIADVAGGLHAAHELKNDRGENLGVVHRDVSPHNILIGTNGVVKLVDFGVAKAKERLVDATVVGQVKGKFGYMSPEQAIARPVDRRSDIFSLGIVLFELTTGRRLFRGDSDAETLALVVQGDIPRPSSIDLTYPPMLEAIVMRALSRSRRERFQTARDFERALERYLKEERIVVPRNGLAGLLKRVLGGSIEQRRRAIRTALKELDGDAHHALISGDSPFTPSDTAEELDAADFSSVSEVTDGQILLSSGELTGSFAGYPAPRPASSQGTDQTAAGQDVPAPGSLIGYAIGVVGLLVLVASLVFYYLRGPARGYVPSAVTAGAVVGAPSRQPTPSRSALAPPAGSRTSRTTASGAPRPEVDGGGLTTVGIDDLAEDGRGASRRATDLRR
jgi:eukaryotic-like serine/threonine-protein kinase